METGKKKKKYNRREREREREREGRVGGRGGEGEMWDLRKSLICRDRISSRE